ncbi:MAG: hypothetical protein WKG03_01635 [Telluria sp.]
MPSPRKRAAAGAAKPSRARKHAAVTVEIRPLHTGATIHVWLVRDAAGKELLRDFVPSENEAKVRAAAWSKAYDPAPAGDS